MKTQIPHNPKIALVYDRLTVQHGGAEDVLQTLKLAFPDATVFTSIWNTRISWTKDWRISSSFLQRIPFSHRLHRVLALLMPLAFETLDFSDFDIILSVSSAEAKGVLTKPWQLHLCYLFTPTRYLYEFETTYAKNDGWHQLPILRQLVSLTRAYLRWWDQQASLRPDLYLTLSQKSARKIQQIYNRPAQVVYPPVLQPLLSSKTSTAHAEVSWRYALSISRLVPYKRVAVAMEACQQSGLPLVIVGTGPDFSHLLKLNPAQTYIRSEEESVESALNAMQKQQKTFLFTRSVSDDEKVFLITNAQSALMLGDEDFGISALQALLFGTPVIVSKNAGASELLSNNSSVTILPSVSASTVKKALVQQQKTHKPIKVPDELKQAVEPKLFIRQMQEIVYDEWRKYMKKYDRK
ncbi:glycosyltransferase [Candidatus Woesebacteria bacterium]|nr:glycosyltransferase [Candidatus Woesebacteria bacterium]